MFWEQKHNSIILILLILSITSCDLITESSKPIVYEVVSIQGNPTTEFKNYANEIEVLDFPLLFFFESVTSPFKGKVVLYKLGVKEFYNITFFDDDYFMVDIDGEFMKANGIKFVWLDFYDGVMNGSFVMIGPLIDGISYEFVAREK